MLTTRQTQVIYALIALFSVSWALSFDTPPATAEAGPDTARGSGTIKELLAQRIAENVCFTGRFTGHKVNISDYSKAKTTPVPGLFEFGKQATRTEPAVYAGREITSVTVLLRHTDLQHSTWDEMHAFELKASVKSWRNTLYAAGLCPWRAEDKPIEDASAASTTSLGCYIDCDGGGMEIERVGGSRDVILRFLTASGGMRMSSGCSSEEGQLYVGGEAKPFDPTDRRVEANLTAFRLKPMPERACAAFAKMMNARK